MQITHRGREVEGSVRRRLAVVYVVVSCAIIIPPMMLWLALGVLSTLPAHLLLRAMGREGFLQDGCYAAPSWGMAVPVVLATAIVVAAWI